jgi:hypothetical protein
MVSKKNKKPRIGLLANTFEVVTKFNRFEGTVVAADSKEMNLSVSKEDGSVIGVTLIPITRIPIELRTEMAELNSSKFRNKYLRGIKGAKELGINHPRKICLLHLRRVRVASDGIDILDAIDRFQ